jgi:hypothetical protein
MSPLFVVLAAPPSIATNVTFSAVTLSLWKLPMLKLLPGTDCVE